MRKTYFIASWKANMPNSDMAKKFFLEMKDLTLNTTHEMVLCPSYVFMETAQKGLSLLAAEETPKKIHLGAQDVSQHPNGPYTGEISASVLGSFGVKYAIVGHMECRARGDTDTITNKKINRLLEQNIVPIIIVVDTLVEYDSNRTKEVLESQLKAALHGVKQWQSLIFCYQPAWSIGTGHYTTREYTEVIISFMRKTIQKITGMPMAGSLPILYGGGITLSNAREYLESPEIDGIMTGLGVTSAKTFADFVNIPFRKK